MSIRYGAPDAFAYVVGVYVCRCGRTAEQHGRHVGEPPPGWVEIRRGGEADHVCPDCAAEPQDTAR